MLNRIRAACFAALIIPLMPAHADEQSEFRLFMKGHFVFEKHCVTCHGKSGRGDGEMAKDVKIKPRNFRLGVFKYRSTPMGFLPTDDDLKRTIKNGVSGTMMPIFSTLSDSDLTAVIAYIKGLSPRWKDPNLVAEAIEIQPPPTWFEDTAQAVIRAKAGGTTFATHCANCHGKSGKGDGPASKTLMDISGKPIPPADLTNPAHHSGPTPGDLFRTIAMGLDGTPMTGNLDSLGTDKIWELIAYIQSLTSP